MSDHDSNYTTDCSTDSQPPRHHPLFAAMDSIRASVAAASINATSPQSSQPLRPPKDSDKRSAQLHADAVVHPEAQLQVVEKENEKIEEWPFLPVRDFTSYTANGIKTGEMVDEAEKTCMSEKYKAYCDDHELMKPVLNLLAHSDQKTQDMIHQLVHTMLDNFGTGYRMEHSISDVASDISLMRKDFGNLHCHCLNHPSPARGSFSAAIVKCLADNARRAHSSRLMLDTSENQTNISKHVKRLMDIAEKESSGAKLTQDEKDLNERDGDKSMSELEDELGFKQTPDVETLVMHVAAFAKLWVDEAEGQPRAHAEKEASDTADKKRKEGDEQEEEDGDSNSTITAV